MPFAGSVVNITSTAITAIASNTTGAGPLEVTLQMSSGTCYLGAATVTTAGFPLTTAETGKFTVSLMQGEVLYATASSAAVGLRKLLHYDW